VLQYGIDEAVVSLEPLKKERYLDTSQIYSLRGGINIE
jgi:hypothetical protein